MITHEALNAATGLLVEPFEADAMDLAHGESGSRILTFLDQARFLPDALANERISIVLATPEIRAAMPDSVPFRVIEVDDPRWYFYTLHNTVARAAMDYRPTVIDPSAIVHPQAHVAEVGVIIGARVVIEPNATVMSGTTIGSDTIVRAGAVLGTEGYEHKRTTRGVVSVVHDGQLTIGSFCEFGANSVVAKGLARRSTVIGDHCKIDACAFIAHCVHLADRVFVVAHAVVCGSLDAEDDVWIGPGAVLRDQITIGARARVGIGSVLLSNVAADTRVLGSPAAPH